MLRRAVFSDAQRKELEKRFQIQKYISKPDRKKLAEKLGLKDSQVECVSFSSYFFFFASVKMNDHLPFVKSLTTLLSSSSLLWLNLMAPLEGGVAPPTSLCLMEN